MATLHTTLMTLLGTWGVITAMLIFLLIYRSALSTHEEDQIFLDSAGDSMANEQRALVAKIEKLSKPITALLVVSVTLLVASGGLWLWQGYRNF
jgi:hypothetical protein